MCETSASIVCESERERVTVVVAATGADNARGD